MGRMLPVFLAFALNCSGVYVFTTPKSLDCLPYLSYVIFLLSVFFLLWDVNLRPVTFRKLFSCAEVVIEVIKFSSQSTFDKCFIFSYSLQCQCY